MAGVAVHLALVGPIIVVVVVMVATARCGSEKEKEKKVRNGVSSW